MAIHIAPVGGAAIQLGEKNSSSWLLLVPREGEPVLIVVKASFTVKVLGITEVAVGSGGFVKPSGRPGQLILVATPRPIE